MEKIPEERNELTMDRLSEVKAAWEYYQDMMQTPGQDDEGVWQRFLQSGDGALGGATELGELSLAEFLGKMEGNTRLSVLATGGPSEVVAGVRTKFGKVIDLHSGKEIDAPLN